MSGRGRPVSDTFRPARQKRPPRRRRSRVWRAGLHFPTEPGEAAERSPGHDAGDHVGDCRFHPHHPVEPEHRGEGRDRRSGRVQGRPHGWCQDLGRSVAASHSPDERKRANLRGGRPAWPRRNREHQGRPAERGERPASRGRMRAWQRAADRTCGSPIRRPRPARHGAGCPGGRTSLEFPTVAEARVPDSMTPRAEPSRGHGERIGSDRRPGVPSRHRKDPRGGQQSPRGPGNLGTEGPAVGNSTAGATGSYCSTV